MKGEMGRNAGARGPASPSATVQHNAPRGPLKTHSGRLSRKATSAMPNPTPHFPTPLAPARARVSALTSKGRLTAAIIRLEHLLDSLTEAEQTSLADELAPIV